MWTFALITLKGLLRDRIFHGILFCVVLYLLIPAGSMLSMRQIAELGITLSLSLTSFVLLFLAVFSGGTALWKDIDRRYVFSAMGLPVSRTSYLLGKFSGIALFLISVSLVLGLFAAAVIWFISSTDPPTRPILWHLVAIAIAFDTLKYCIVVAIALVLSTVSTSFFLPVFGAIAAFIAGNISQEVFDYIQSPAAATLSPLAKTAASGLYYLLPNFAAFNLKANAIYSIAVPAGDLLLTAAYGLMYLGILLTIAALLFGRREFL